MKRLLKRIEDIMVAVTFAEAGEYDEARNILCESADETLEKLPQEVAETAQKLNENPGRIEIHRGGFFYNYYYDIHPRSDASGYTLRVLVRDMRHKKAKEKNDI